MRLASGFTTHVLSWSYDISILFYCMKQLTPPVTCFGNRFFIIYTAFAIDFARKFQDIGQSNLKVLDL